MMEFMKSKPIFNPPHVWDIMKEVNNMFSPNGLSPKNPIDTNEYKNEGIDIGGPFIDPPTFD
jgi:hypothetical protein